MEMKDPIEEARRYLQNAKDILRDKAIKDGDFYTDSKYTRMAGNCMWNGCLIALKYALGLKAKRGQRLDIKDFQESASKRNKKLLNEVNEGYNIMHLSMGYDGTKDVGTIASGIKRMNNIIDWCEINAPRTLSDTTAKDKPRAKRTKTKKEE